MTTPTREELLAKLKRPSQAQDKTGCARSHPHENMSEECQIKATEAREVNHIRGEELRQQERNEPASVSHDSVRSGAVDVREEIEPSQEILSSLDKVLSRAQATQPAQQAPAVSDEQILEVLQHLDCSIALCAKDEKPVGGVMLRSPYAKIWKSSLERYAATIRALLSQPVAAPVSLSSSGVSEQPLARLHIGGVTGGELDDNDIEPCMTAIEKLQERFVSEGNTSGVVLDLFAAPSNQSPGGDKP